MATAEVNGVKLYYEAHGSGEPILMIMGLGANATAWGAQVPALSRDYKVVVFDNRGAGRSEKPANGYSIPQMANDAITLMDALDIETAHVFGMSMGGMIAQEVYHQHPERVRTLILAGTMAGGPMAKLPRLTTFAQIGAGNGGSLENSVIDGLRLFYSDGFIEANEARLVKRAVSQMSMVAPPHALRGQFGAVLGYNGYSKLRKIEVPTLILGATDDKLMPFRNQEELARRIPEAKFVPFEGAGHGFIFERAEAVNRTVLAFLKEHQGAAHAE